MGKPRVFLRTDGDEQIGLGHLMRSLALGSMLKDNFDIVLVTGSRPGIIEKISADVCDDVHYLPVFSERNAEARYVAKLLHDHDSLVLDGYGFDLSYQEYLRKAASQLVSIDDTHLDSFASDLIINPSGQVESSSYNAHPGTVFALGPKYVLLRPSFLRAAQASRDGKSDKNTLTICMGGADPQNFTLRTLQEVSARVPKEWTFQVVLGAAYAFKKDLVAFMEDSDYNYKLLTNLDASQMVQLFEDSQFVISSASTMASEAACTRAGLFLRQTADNQQGVYEYFVAEGLARPYHEFEITSDVSEMIGNQTQVFDGLSAQRVQKLFTKMLEAANISFRATNVTDCDLYFRWANDQSVRQASFSSEEIPYDEHVVWFKKNINDPQQYFFVAEKGGEEMGQLRFARTGNEVVISFALDSAYRGQGMGLHLVRKGMRMLSFQEPMIDRYIGFVKKENRSSCHIFRMLGFQERDAVIYPNAIRFEYDGN